MGAPHLSLLIGVRVRMQAIAMDNDMERSATRDYSSGNFSLVCLTDSPVERQRSITSADGSSVNAPKRGNSFHRCLLVISNSLEKIGFLRRLADGELKALFEFP